MAGGGDDEAAVQKALQSVAESTGWTYSLLWRLCPRQGALVWAEGHYNGAIRTRKTTVGAAGEEETGAGVRAALRRSRQLKELYNWLAADGGGGGASGSGGAQQQHRRPTAAALAPEDLTETEWFYLMCASYCFPPAVGLPGEAFVRKVHVWLCDANKVDSKVFSRAILARSAGIQTVACIPVDNNGVLEIGTTEKVEEDIYLIQYARSIFMDQRGSPIAPTLSGHSTSTPTTHINHQPFQTKMGNCIGDINVQKNSLNSREEQNDEMEDDNRIDLETNTGNYSSRHSLQDKNAGNEKEMVQFSAAAEDKAALAENAHYVETVMAILRFNAFRQTQAGSNTKAYLALSENSSFSRWNHKASNDLQTILIPEDTPQRMLKNILLGAPSSNNSHRSYRGDAAVQSPEPRDDDVGEGTSRSLRGPVPVPVQAAAELSGRHVHKERRRREKLNEMFVMLRSLVPFVTKMDRASILGDTIEYVKQLRRRIQELESSSSRARLVDGSNPKAAMAPPQQSPPAALTETKRDRHHSSVGEPPAGDTELQVSIIGSEALLELRCPHREGLLLRVMQALQQDLLLEITSVQASSAGDVLLAELRAKVKEVHGRRRSISEVKRAIHLIVSSD